ncbi:hypothetical protein SAMN04488490_0245 [Marinobacter sp. LV10R510-11A]|uniref:hypothetical protein n=1 Tax=Marinobacter sp. LV10R510-11A TaxID=1415568 RepID=UPI000BB8C4E1|nr:hypothetical protein [Marinobacter sp. LV10R510-11A]SOB74720.1 hypothetical protein SAMN04488490_0245 [Marinobacter sp. LV10R510-11A]
MLNEFTFKIPEFLMPGIADRSLTRFGSIIKNTQTGKIVAHVQETGLGQQIFSSLASSPFSPLEAVSSLAANVQLGQLKRMVEGLQVLQYANLGVALTGVGVSVVGFAVVNKKLKNIQSSIERVSSKIDQRFVELYEHQLRRDFYTLRGVLEHIESVRRQSKPKSELMSAGSRLTEISSIMRGQLEYQLQLPAFDEYLFTQLTRAMLMSDNARVEAYIVAEEYDSAHHAATSISESYCNLFDDITPFDLKQKKRLRSIDLREKARETAENITVGASHLVAGLRDITDSAFCKPVLIEELGRRGIAGSDYLSALRNETKEPIVLLQFSD